MSDTHTWQMPSVHVGAQVKVYPFSRWNESGVVGTVQEVWPDSIDVLANGVYYEAIRHKDDPLLPTNQNWLDNGSWELMDSAVSEERIAKLEASIANLQDQLDGLQNYLCDRIEQLEQAIANSGGSQAKGSRKRNQNQAEAAEQAQV